MDKKDKTINRVIVIGIDSACFKMLRQLIQKEKLPNIKQLMDKGVYGDLKSTIPYWTAPAWTSIFTGVNPGKHGIYDFIQVIKGNKRLVNSYDVKTKFIWEYLSERGIKSIVINVPLTYPIRKFNGILLPGYLSPYDAKGFPEETIKDMKKIIGKYSIYSKEEMQGKTYKELFNSYQKLIENRTKTAIFLGKKYEWNMLILQFQKTDTIFHNYNLDKTAVEDPREIYYKVDECIGQILKELGDKATVFIVSDHGMGKKKKIFYLNPYLERKGLLKYRKGQTLTFNEAKNLLIAKTNFSITELFDKFRAHPYVFLKSLAKRFFPENVVRFFRRVIDEEKSKFYLYSSTSLAIIINNNLGYKKKEKIREKVKGKLLNYYDNDGKAFFDTVLLKEEIFNGREIENLPDIFLIPNKDYLLSSSYSKKVVEKKKVFDHEPYGLFICSGKHIQTKGHIDNITVLDIAPTLLYLLSLPIPNELDGRVIKKCFSAEYLRRNKIVHKEIDWYKKGGRNEDKIVSEDEIRDRLKALGYID